MLRAAEGSATRGREQHELRPRVDDFFLWTERKWREAALGIG